MIPVDLLVQFGSKPEQNKACSLQAFRLLLWRYCRSVCSLRAQHSRALPGRERDTGSQLPMATVVPCFCWFAVPCKATALLFLREKCVCVYISLLWDGEKQDGRISCMGSSVCCPSYCPVSNSGNRKPRFSGLFCQALLSHLSSLKALQLSLSVLGLGGFNFAFVTGKP